MIIDILETKQGKGNRGSSSQMGGQLEGGQGKSHENRTFEGREGGNAPSKIRRKNSSARGSPKYKGLEVW
jgi:hypothetical protein